MNEKGMHLKRKPNEQINMESDDIQKPIESRYLSGYTPKKRQTKNDLIEGNENLVDNSNKISKNIGINVRDVVAFFVVVTFILFAFSILRIGILPTKYAVILLLVVFSFGFVFVLFDIKSKKSRRTMGLVFSMLYIIVLIIFSAVAIKGYNSVNTIFTAQAKREYTTYVYVLENDEAKTIEETAGYTYGVLSDVDREEVDNSLENISDIVNGNFVIVEYSSLMNLFSDLESSKIDAAVLADYEIEMLQEIEGYENAGMTLRILQNFTLVKESTAETVFEVHEEKNENIICVYLSGIDRWGTLRSRSDVNILAFINTSTHQVFLLNTPRDYYLQTAASAPEYDKLTHAGLFGVECSMETLENLYNIKIDYYVRINFQGFVDIVDLIGPIEVEAEFQGETYVFNGEEALAFARNRGYAQGDRQRGRNQIYIIKAIIKKMITSDAILKFDKILETSEKYFNTSIPYGVVSAMVREQLNYKRDWNIVSYGVDGTSDMKEMWAMKHLDSDEIYAYAMIPSMETVEYARNLIEQFESGEIIAVEEDIHK